MDDPPVDICSDSFRCCLFLAPGEKQPVMSESQNIEESTEDEKSERQEEVTENISPQEPIEQTEAQIETSDIITSDINTSDILNMEVHHHPQLKHERKPWKEYFLEYLMIVLAVTTGFFAESLREHLGDTSKEHEYIASLKKIHCRHY